MTCTTNASKSNSASGAFLEPPGTGATRPRTVRHVSIAASGSQANFSSVQGLLLAKAAPEPNTYRRNLRGRGSHELAPIGLNMQANVSPRPLLGILAVTERTGLIAKKGPRRLCWPSAWCRQVARHGGLGDA
jgi:hypothetical protein